ncbi:hypothetical protein SAY87_028837 [Trapa incisa]|uniref:Uncharacterized protein n=1 Tax=Trapa incisa TaxID=236973 RepID=A0AAN7KPV4_9MYRT|nr:hypothetical protein SAY87_028837 [Trapa incisa]
MNPSGLDWSNDHFFCGEETSSKYRLYLTRLQKENGSKACFSGAKHSETANPSVNFSMQASIMPQEEIRNKNFTVSGNKLPVQNANPIDNGDDLKSTVLVPREESKQSLIDEVPNLQESSRGIETGFKPSFMPFLHEERYAEFNSNTPAHYSWRGVPEAALKEESDAHIRVEDSGCLLKSTNSRPRLAEDQGIDLKEYKPLYADCRRKNIVGQNPLTMQSNNAIAQEKDNLAYCQDFQTIHTSPPKIQGRDIDSSGPHFPYTAHEKVSSVSGSTFGPSDENLQVAWLENCQFSTNIRIQNSDFIGYSDQCFVSEVPIHSYETLRFDYEPFMDPSECSIADHVEMTEQMKTSDDMSEVVLPPRVSSQNDALQQQQVLLEASPSRYAIIYMFNHPYAVVIYQTPSSAIMSCSSSTAPSQAKQSFYQKGHSHSPFPSSSQFCSPHLKSELHFMP